MNARKLPELSALELFVTVAETGSLGQAAARHGISQPSASARIRSLEHHLGIQLLMRSTTGSRLTDAGLLISGWAREILEHAVALMESAGALRAEQQDRLRVTASLTIAEYLVPDWLVALRESTPQVQVGLQVTNSQTVLEGVRRGEYDLGFVETPSVPGDLHSTVVGRDRVVVVVTPSHPWARRRRPVEAVELASTPLLLRETGSGTRDTLEAALAEVAAQPLPLLVLGATAPLRSAVVAGIGPAVLSALAVADDLKAGRLVEVPVAASLRLARRLRAVWPRGRQLPEPAMRMIQVARWRTRAAVASTQSGQRPGELGRPLTPGARSAEGSRLPAEGAAPRPRLWGPQHSVSTADGHSPRGYWACRRTRIRRNRPRYGRANRPHAGKAGRDAGAALWRVPSCRWCPGWAPRR